jgi:hypothetical protein
MHPKLVKYNLLGAYIILCSHHVLESITFSFNLNK